MIDLSHCSPQELASKATLHEILEAVKTMKDWSERPAQVLDHIYRVRLAAFLRCRDYSEQLLLDMSEFSEHLERVTHPRRAEQLNNLEHAYIERWFGYLDILEDRIAALQNSAVESILERKYVKDILVLLLEEHIDEQSEIRKLLNLSQPNLTRILDLMEQNELIHRRKRGRKNIVEPGINLERVRHLFNTETSKAARGTNFLALEAA